MAKYTKGSFVTIPNKEYLRGKKSEIQSLFFWLCEHADDEGICYPTRKTLSEESGVGIRTLDDCLNVLIQDGVLVKTHRRKLDSKEFSSNLYQIMLVEGVVSKKTLPSVKKDTTPSVKKDAETQSIINSTQITLSENEISEEKISKLEFDLINGKHWEEKTNSNGDVQDMLCHPCGKPLTDAELKSLQIKYNQLYKTNTPSVMESIISSKVVAVKPKYDVTDVFQLFESINVAHEDWIKIPAYRESAKKLLEKFSIDTLSEMVALSYKNKDDKFCPKIRTPHDLLHKMANIEQYKLNNKESVKRINPFK